MGEPSPVVVLIGRRPPHEVLLLAVSIPLGLGMLTRAPAPASVIALMPAWVVVAWATALMLSGIVGVASAVWTGDILRALWAELGALLLGAGVFATYTAAVFVSAGMRAWFSGGFMGAWAVANLIRCAQIRREVRRLTAGARLP
ncbi:hypothetical protein Rhe02_55730 [Rhizocola hellebori]|uniref:Uncharacterized protein n=1 Tax=Rhizocola hellebori TaxID=1392758 RepID=A0A8J3QDU5_9ACTN|nr:hypothetical protein [Rhizocola hellebori]GIH07506.1 hypothetical protein Rhe02_55730 [Rhizocola hellebori]